MKQINPMRKIFIVLSSFGIIVGLLFPVYAGLFIDWAPGQKVPFIISCIFAGFIVGIFAYIIVRVILKQIDISYKNILFNKLNINKFNTDSPNNDFLLSMKSEFEELVNKFDSMKKNEEKRLKELSITDCLTSLYNHRHFHDCIKEKIESKSENLCLLFCDIDLFKLINDTYGHTMGDSILKEVSWIIKNEVREDDLVFRYGGEEFIILLENVTLNRAEKLAEKIRTSICNSKSLNEYTSGTAVTISIGLALSPDHGSNLDELMMKADTAMYYAKENGRNQSRVFNESMNNIN